MGESGYYQECEIESSGRVVLPQGWRAKTDLSSGVVLLPHLPAPIPDYLAADIWPNTDDYELHLERIDELYYSRNHKSRDLLRLVYSSIGYEPVDEDGGVLVRGTVRDLAALEGTIICVELVDHIELWNADRWKDRMWMFDSSMTSFLPGESCGGDACG
ncbi:MAG: hypothetical protein ACYC1B_02910 [Thermoleophilia bacterium]